MLTVYALLLVIWVVLNWLSPLATLAAADEMSGGRVPAHLLQLARALGARFYLSRLERGPGFSAWVWGWGHMVVLDRAFLSHLTPEHVRFVMAHELGHVALGHLKVRWLFVVTGLALLPATRRRLLAHETEADEYAFRLTGFRREHFDRPDRIISGGGNHGRQAGGLSQ